MNEEHRSVGSTHFYGLTLLWHPNTAVPQVHAIPPVPLDLVVTVWVTKIFSVVVGAPGIIQNCEVPTGVSTLKSTTDVETVHA